MKIGGHQWPVKFKKADEVYSTKQLTCRHPDDERLARVNGSALWDICGACQMMIGYAPKAALAVREV